MNLSRRYSGGILAPGLWTLLLALAQADDWPQWRGLNRDGIWNENGVLESFPKAGLKIAWRTPVGRGWSSPVVAKGRVYLTDVEVTRPKATERVLCFDAAGGRRLWSREYVANYPDWAFDPNAGGPRSTPIVQGGGLFTLGATGRLLCLDARRGDVVWEKDLAGEYGLEPFSGITASPVIQDKLLILYICGKPSACVVALDKNSGKEMWRALDDSFTYSSPIVVKAGGKKQLIVWTQEAVTSLDPVTGWTWWRESLRTPGDMAVSTPVCSGPWLLIGGLMFRLDADKPTAAILWPEQGTVTRRILSNTSTAIMRGDYVFSARISGELVCLDARTGAEIWRTNSVTSRGNGSSIHLTPNRDSVLLFTDEGNLIRARLSAQGYQEISRVHLLDPDHPFNGRNVLWPPPAYSNRHIFARNDHELVCASLAAEP